MKLPRHRRPRLSAQNFVWTKDWSPGSDQRLSSRTEQHLGMSENWGYPKMATLMRNVNPIFRQNHIFGLAQKHENIICRWPASCVRERERKKKNVPLLSAYLTHSRREIWQASVRGLQPRGVSCGVHLKQPKCVERRVHQRFNTASNWWRNVILDYFRLFKMIEWGFNDKTKQKHHFVEISFRLLEIDQLSIP